MITRASPILVRPGRPRAGRRTAVFVCPRLAAGTGRRLASLVGLVLCLLFPRGAVRPRPVRAQEGGGGAALELAGVVRDVAGVPLAGARVLVVELDRAVLTDAAGAFRLAGVAPGRYTLDVRRAGYAPAVVPAPVPGRPVEVRLRPAPIPVEPLTVTVTRGPFSPLRSPLPASFLGRASLDREQGISLAHALERLPGVRTLSTGRHVGKPVIRGLSGARVVVLSQGLRLEDYAWSDEDAPSVDAALVDRVEVIRGPATVLYGPDAVGGVVNAIPAPLPDAGGGGAFARGEAELGGASNNRELALIVRGEGAAGGWGWRAAVAGRRSGNLQTPEGELENTGLEALNGEAAVGRRGAWGSVTARYARYGGEFRLLEEDAPPPDSAAPEEEGPERKLSDDRIQLLGSFPLGALRLEARFQGQRHRLIELEDDPEALRQGRRVEVAVFDLTLDTGTGELLLHHAPAPGVQGTAGVSAQLQSSTGRGAVPLVPDASLGGVGLFLLERLERGPLTLLAGARADTRRVDADGHAARAFRALSWSGGAVWRAGPLSAAANLGTAWRAPTLFELYASGPRLGEARYEIGRADLDRERSRNVDLGVRWETARVRAQLSAFRNDFRGFLFIQPTGEVRDGYRIFRYDQADAVLWGGEASLELDPAPALTVGARGDLVRGTNRARREPLPLMPPPRITLQAELHGRWPHGAGRASLAAEAEYVAEPRLNPLDLPVDDYALLHLGAGWEGETGGRPVQVSVRVRNATNAAYKDFLSRYKAFALNPGRDVLVRMRIGF